MKKHFVTFYSLGMIFAEDTTREIDSWDIKVARKMAADIVERYGARPYGFRFSTRVRGPKDFEPRETKRSGTYFIGCRVLTLADVERESGADSILASNMRGNRWSHVVTSVTGWRFTVPVEKGDVVLDVHDRPVALTGASS